MVGAPKGFKNHESSGKLRTSSFPHFSPGAQAEGFCQAKSRPGGQELRLQREPAGGSWDQLRCVMNSWNQQVFQVPRRIQRPNILAQDLGCPWHSVWSADYIPQALLIACTTSSADCIVGWHVHKAASPVGIVPLGCSIINTKWQQGCSYFGHPLPQQLAAVLHQFNPPPTSRHRPTKNAWGWDLRVAAVEAEEAVPWQEAKPQRSNQASGQQMWMPAAWAQEDAVTTAQFPAQGSVADMVPGCDERQRSKGSQLNYQGGGQEMEFTEQALSTKLSLPSEVVKQASRAPLEAVPCAYGSGSMDAVARRMGINLLDIERYKKVFDSYDTNNSGKLENLGEQHCCKAEMPLLRYLRVITFQFRKSKAFGTWQTALWQKRLCIGDNA
eukprot:Skav211554  [mRNA]  locus=scaffold2228:66797:74701:+ [translate_table: standard]